MKKRILTISLLLTALLPALPAQSGFFIPEGKPFVEIPFEFSNNFIILEVVFQGKFPLNFIYDTGSEHTILTKRVIADILGLPYERTFHIIGSDLKTELTAYLVRRTRFDLPNKVVAPREDILVLDEDYFRFEEYAGVNVHGILAGNVFGRYLIRINYQRKIITLFDRESNPDLGKGYETLPVELFRQKLYLNTEIEVQRDSAAPVKLLLDTGAGLSMLLFTNTHPLLAAPPNAIPGNIGMGLGGYLDGFHGRVSHLSLGNLEQKGIVTQFQLLDSLSSRDYLNSRNGLIGNVILSRFLLVLDYQNEKIMLKPTKHYKKTYRYDRSGLGLIAGGNTLGQFTVQRVLPNSPAAAADFRPGDRIKRIGLWPAYFFALENVVKKLEGKPGKTIRIAVKRDGKRLRKKIVLRELL